MSEKRATEMVLNKNSLKKSNMQNAQKKNSLGGITKVQWCWVLDKITY